MNKMDNKTLINIFAIPFSLRLGATLAFQIVSLLLILSKLVSHQVLLVTGLIFINLIYALIYAYTGYRTVSKFSMSILQGAGVAAGTGFLAAVFLNSNQSNFEIILLNEVVVAFICGVVGAYSTKFLVKKNSENIEVKK